MAWWRKRKEVDEEIANLRSLLLHSRFRANRKRRPLGRTAYRFILVLGAGSVIGAGLFHVLF
ncbi:MAG: hypothetical protein ACI8W8_002689 [Rhodothermales bacterium]|jgi:hypothetical protein